VTATRAARNWAELALHTGLLLVGLGLLQVAAERTNHRIDLTTTRELSLAPRTEQVVREIGAALRITVFYRRGTREQYTGLLSRLQMANPRVDYELLDLDRYPERARALGISQYGRAAIEYDDRRVVTLALPEEQLTSGIVQAVRGRARRVLFSSGHGEREPAGEGDGYGRFVAALAAENCRAEATSLLQGDVPDDADLVVVAGPRHDFLPVEVDRLAAYLRRGGAVLLLLDPGPLPNVAELLASMGIQLGDDIIVDREHSVIGTDGLAAVVELFKRGNPISEPSANPIESGAVLPSARSVDVVAPAKGVEAAAIARTGPSAWAMADPDRARRGETPSTAAHDRPGGAAVVVMAELGHDERRGRVVVVGDADFASDAYLDLLGNRDLVMNAVAWLREETILAGERAPAKEVFRPLSPLVLTERQAHGLFLGVAILQPGLVLLAGLVVVGIRRRRG